MVRRQASTLLFGLATISLAFSEPALAQTWRSELYPETWVPPETLASPPSFESDKIIQDYSYAGYHRGEKPIPDVAGPIFDVVADFGAVPDGQTDVTTHIQAAIDAAEGARGGVVYLPAGTYRIRPQGSAQESLRITQSGVVLRGAGRDQTFLFNDSYQMRDKTIIRVDGRGSVSNAAWFRQPSGSPVTRLSTDLLSPTRAIPVEDLDGFEVGDWIILRADVTPEFKAEHNMEDLWEDLFSPTQPWRPTITFVRRIVSMDAIARTVTIDVPTRYYLKTRDDARMHLAPSHIDEVGIEDLAIGNREHPDHGTAEGLCISCSSNSAGWGTNDHSNSDAPAYDLSKSTIVRLFLVRNSWIRRVDTYRPTVNELNAHILSNAISMDNTLSSTIEDVHLQRPVYSGTNGNGYMITVHSSQEMLLKDVRASYNRHGISFMNMPTSGNVVVGGRAEYTGWSAIGRVGGNGMDFHMHLSPSNLVDGMQMFEDYFSAAYRSTFGANHGQTTTHTMFWNLEGLGYHEDRNFLVATQQARFGYVVGTRGPFSAVTTDSLYSIARGEEWRHLPEDHVEGEGLGETLEPASLYYDQLQRRLGTPEPVPDDCLEIDLWQHHYLAAGDDDDTYLFDARAHAANVNIVMGFSEGVPASFFDLATIVRFNQDGQVDARNGSDYEALESLNYVAHTDYRFRFVVDLSNGTYDVYVTADVLDREVVIANDFAFRTEQQGVASLEYFGGGAFGDSASGLVCLIEATRSSPDPDPEPTPEPDPDPEPEPEPDPDPDPEPEPDPDPDPEPDPGPDPNEPVEDDPAPVSPRLGCDCSTSGGAGASGLALLLGLAWLLRRRRGSGPLTCPLGARRDLAGLHFQRQVSDWA